MRFCCSFSIAVQRYNKNRTYANFRVSFLKKTKKHFLFPPFHFSPFTFLLSPFTFLLSTIHHSAHLASGSIHHLAKLTFPLSLPFHPAGNASRSHYVRHRTVPLPCLSFNFPLNPSYPYSGSDVKKNTYKTFSFLSVQNYQKLPQNQSSNIDKRRIVLIELIINNSFN